MASKTYQLRALVLRRTKLGETDVICTLLAQDGSQVRAVAKGARKPNSSFASRLEVYSVCDLLLSEGKSLDIVKEARLVQGNAHLRSDISLMEAAAPMVELLDKASQDGLQDERLFPMACSALAHLNGQGSAPAVALTAAELLKTLAVLGFRPRFDLCVGCGKPMPAQKLPANVAFSLVEGGLVCQNCASASETIWVTGAMAAWAQAFLFSTFEEICSFDIGENECFEVLRFLQMWMRQHLGTRLKSLEFLISNPL